MIYSLYLLLFITSIVLVFIVNNIYFLLGYILIQICLMIYFKIKPKDLKKIIKNNLFLLITVLIINCIFMNLLEGILLFIKLFIVLLATYINKYILTDDKLVKAINNLLFFIKDKESISLVILLSLSLIPVLNKLIHDIRLSLKSRNFNLNIKNITTKSYIMFITFINQIFKKTNEIELSLISRGFNR